MIKNFINKTNKLSTFAINSKKATFRIFFNDVYNFIERKKDYANSNKENPLIISGLSRIGKTTIIKQYIHKKIASGSFEHDFLYIPLNKILLKDHSLIEIVSALETLEKQPKYIFLDSIHTRRNWIDELMNLQKLYPAYTFVAISNINPGMFDDSFKSSKNHIIIPPITFNEFIHLRKKESLLFTTDENKNLYIDTNDITEINKEFYEYLRNGCFIDSINVKSIEAKNKNNAIICDQNMQHVMNNIFSCSSYYGVKDNHILNKIFNYLILNNSKSHSFEDISIDLDIAKNTVKKYIHFLEASYLITRSLKLTSNAKLLQRQTRFKILFPHSCFIFHNQDINQISDYKNIVQNAICIKFFFSNFNMGYLDKKNPIEFLLPAPNFRYAINTNWIQEDMKNQKHSETKQKHITTFIHNNNLNKNTTAIILNHGIKASINKLILNENQQTTFMNLPISIWAFCQYANKINSFYNPNINPQGTIKLTTVYL